MEVLIALEEMHIKIHAMNNVGTWSLLNYLKHLVTNQTFKNDDDNTTIKTSSDPDIAFSQYLTLRPNILRPFHIEYRIRKLIWESFGTEIKPKICIDELDSVVLHQVLQKSPDFPTCIAKHRNVIECSNQCNGKCCLVCRHPCLQCGEIECKLDCCITMDGCNHPCENKECNATLHECHDNATVCCSSCKLCENCKQKTAAELCPSEEIREYADTIIKSRNFALNLTRATNRTLHDNKFSSVDFPDCHSWKDLWKYVRRSIEGVLTFLLNSNHFTQIEYDDEIDRLFDIQVNQKRQVMQDHYIQIINELESLHYYKMLKQQMWPHIEHLRDRRHYLTLIVRKKQGWFFKKNLNWVTRDIGLFGNVAPLVHKQVKSILKEELGENREEYTAHLIRCQFKEKYTHPEYNSSMDVQVIVLAPSEDEELPEYLQSARSDESIEIWKSVTDATSEILRNELHIETSMILTHWEYGSLYIQTIISRENGEFSPWEEVFVLEVIKRESIRSFSNENIAVAKMPMVEMRRDSVEIQIEINSKNEEMLDRVDKILHRAKHYDFLNY